nr:CRISPR-associated endonuclease Cas3'' [Bifidobacterium breve]
MTICTTQRNWQRALKKRSSVTAFAAGLLHDSGKATDDFKRYLLTGNRKRGEVVHAKQGAFIVDDCAADFPSSAASMITAEVLELAIANHHGHLPDCLDACGGTAYFRKLTGENKKSRAVPLSRSTEPCFFLKPRYKHQFRQQCR